MTHAEHIQHELRVALEHVEPVRQAAEQDEAGKQAQRGLLRAHEHDRQFALEVHQLQRDGEVGCATNGAVRRGRREHRKVSSPMEISASGIE